MHVFSLKLLHKEPDHPAFKFVSNSNCFASNLCFFYTHMAKLCLPEVSFGIGERCCREQGGLKASCIDEASREYKNPVDDADDQRIIVFWHFALTLHRYKFLYSPASSESILLLLWVQKRRISTVE